MVSDGAGRDGTRHDDRISWKRICKSTFVILQEELANLRPRLISTLMIYYICFPWELKFWWLISGFTRRFLTWSYCFSDRLWPRNLLDNLLFSLISLSSISRCNIITFEWRFEIEFLETFCMYSKTCIKWPHHDVTVMRWRLKSPASRLFT